MSAWEKLYYYAVTVHRAYDGDSIVDSTQDMGRNIHITKEPIRWHGIDCPEIRGKTPIEKQMAICAREFVMDLLPEDDRALLKSVKDRSDKYGRFMAYLFTNADGEIDAMQDLPPIEMSINHMLVRHRLAYAYEGGRRPTSDNKNFWPDWYEDHASEINPLLERYAA